MADLEFLVTDGCYESDLSEPATYVDASKQERAILCIPEQSPDILIESADVGVRGSEETVRVRVSEVAQPCKGDRIRYFNRERCVDEYDRLNIAEWVLYVIP